MELIVYPGIGDISWLISKLSTTGKEFDLVIAEDNKMHRALPLVDMVPCIHSARYGGRDIYKLLYGAGNHTFADYMQADSEGKQLCMSANKWLEDGNRLEGYLDDLDTDYHYQINIDVEDNYWASNLLYTHTPTLAIYTSSIGGISSWSAWSALEWTDFLSHVRNSYPNTLFVLLGAKWDQDMRRDLCRLFDDERFDYIDLLGKTTLGRALAIIKHVSYFVGYASGLTILSDVLDKPTTMLYPKHLTKLANAWPDPANLASGKHTGILWQRPIDVFNKIKPQLEKYLG